MPCVLLISVRHNQLRDILENLQNADPQSFHIRTFSIDPSGRILVAADLVIFDPNTVTAHEPEWANDYPAGSKRLVQRSEGIHYTIVNGSIIHENGRMSGKLPGQILRGAL